MNKIINLLNKRTKLKTTVMSAVYLIFAVLLCLSVLPIVNENVPLDAKPLPDLWFAIFPLIKDTYHVTDTCLCILLGIAVSIVLLHEQGFLVFRRAAFIIGTLYLYRAVAILVTTLPVSEKNLICASKTDWSPPLLLKRLIAQLIGLENSHLCGSYMISGHTLLIITLQLIIQQYSFKKIRFVLGWGSWLLAYVGLFMIMLSHKHYSIDVLIAYLLTSRLYWNYHALCNVEELSLWVKNNPAVKPWWFSIFCFLEQVDNLPSY